MAHLVMAQGINQSQVCIMVFKPFLKIRGLGKKPWFVCSSALQLVHYQTEPGCGQSCDQICG